MQSSQTEKFCNVTEPLAGWLLETNIHRTDAVLAVTLFITIWRNAIELLMNQNSMLPVLGRCPLCEQRLDSEYLLAAYVDDGWPRMLAECPECVEVVHPL